MRIFQLTPTITLGDGVSQGVLLIAGLFDQWELNHSVVAKDIATELQHCVAYFDQVEPQPDDILLYHHSVGIESPVSEWVLSFPGRKLLIYHNITPSFFFETGSLHHYACELGREQLSQWVSVFDASLADSIYNEQELVYLGYAPTQTLPLLFDLQSLIAKASQPVLEVRSDSRFNLLFVGRIAPNKCQHQLIHLLIALQRCVPFPVRLTLVGGVSSTSYHEYLVHLIDIYQLNDSVYLTGKVDEESLRKHYRQADIFISLSEHEGFGIPLIEAMVYQVPVVAYAAGAIESTMGGAGLLLNSKHYPTLVQALLPIMLNPQFRRSLVSHQNKRLESFNFQGLSQSFYDWLTHQGVLINTAEKCIVNSASSTFFDAREWQIQGPIDSDYSLALVNRELAFALSLDQPLSVYPTEGFGNYPLDKNYLEGCAPDLLSLLTQQPVCGPESIVMRNLYPPRLTESQGSFMVLGPFGWEESQLPQQIVDQINSRAHLVLAMSEYVKQVLINNGVFAPIEVVGLGADHIVRSAAEVFELPTRNSKSFFHVSSAFPRKGVDVLIEAFGRAIAPWQDAQLVIKTFANPHNQINDDLIRAGWKTNDYRQEGVQVWRRQVEDCANITVIWQSLTTGQLRYLYEQATAFVAPTRGEGFGLPQAEAMLCRCPVITTDRGGQADFCTDSTAWLLPSQPQQAQSHLSVSHSLWFEPDISALINWFDVFACTSVDINAKLEAAYCLVNDYYRWSSVALRVQKMIHHHRQVSKSRYSSIRVGLVSTWNQACGIANYSQHLSCAFEAEQWWVFAPHVEVSTSVDQSNVVRCWQSGQSDDLAILWQALQQQQITHVHIQFNFNFFRLSALSQLIHRLDDQGIAVWITLHATEDVAAQHGAKSLRQIACALNKAELFVHSLADLHRLNDWGISRYVKFAHGVVGMSRPPVPTTASVQACLTRWQQQGGYVIASYGFLLPHKGIHQLIEAFIHLKAIYPSLKLLLLNALYPAGVSVQTASECQAMIEASPHADDILLFTEFTQEQQALSALQQSQLIVMPYQQTQESSSAAVRFALAADKPVMVTPLTIFSDVAEVVIQLPGTSSQAIAQGLSQQLFQPDHLQKRRRQWLREHDWHHISRRLWNRFVACAPRH